MPDSSITNKLRPIDDLSLVDRVELRLTDILASDDLQAGDLLPKEVELAEAFGVSRTVIREALTRLKVLGLVKSVKHKGTVVTYPDLLENLKRIMHPQILDEGTLKDVFETRLVMEVGMADMLFARITEQDLDELSEIVLDEPGGGVNMVFDADFEVRFHGKLYDITGNDSLKGFQYILLPIFGYVHESGMLKGRNSDAEYVSHEELVHILQDGTPEEFRKGMREHLDSQFQRIL